jgi:ubiquinol-cytochrome c reductase cytochrome b subunit
VVVVPLLLLALAGLRVLGALVTKPAQRPGPGRTEENVVGVPLLPTAATRAAGLAAFVIGLLVALGAAVTIDPVWRYGPASPSDATAGSQPDWYTGFLDGALRLVPPGWELVWLGHTWTTAILIPLAVVSLALALVAGYPFLEAWATRDAADHHLLDRPRDTPTRTGIGVAGVVFFGVLWAAGSADLTATAFHLSIEGVVRTLQVCVLLGPPLAFAITRRVCLALRRREREIAEHGRPTGRIVRLPGGEYIEVHGPAAGDPARPVPAPLPELRPDDRGRVTATARARHRLGRLLLEDAERRPDAEPDAVPAAAGSPHRAHAGRSR